LSEATKIQQITPYDCNSVTSLFLKIHVQLLPAFSTVTLGTLSSVAVLATRYIGGGHLLVLLGFACELNLVLLPS